MLTAPLRCRRNEAQLRALGLMDAKENLAAATAPRPKAPAKRKATAPTAPSRKSRRTQGEAPEYGPSLEVGGDATLTGPGEEEDPELVAAREAARERRYERLMRRHAVEGLELPANASYAHTVMRVDTMSEAALSNRVKVMERAAGSYAVIKMRQFAEVRRPPASGLLCFLLAALQLSLPSLRYLNAVFEMQVLIMENYEEVAAEAEAALQRLLEMPKFKGKNWAQMLEIAKEKKGPAKTKKKKR